MYSWNVVWTVSSTTSITNSISNNSFNANEQLSKQILKWMTVNNMNMRYNVRYARVWKHNALTPAAPPEYQQTICRSRCKNPWPWTTRHIFTTRIEKIDNFLLHPPTLRKILGQQNLLPLGGYWLLIAKPPDTIDIENFVVVNRGMDEKIAFSPPTNLYRTSQPRPTTSTVLVGS